MEIEEALDKIASIRQNLHIHQIKHGKVICGIRAIDKVVKGFDTSKIYGVVARPGNGIYSFASTIGNSIDVLYQTNYSVLIYPDLSGKKDPKDLWSFINDQNKFLTHKEVFTAKDLKRPGLIHRPILLIGDIPELTTEEFKVFKAKTRRWWHAEVLVICLHVLNDEQYGPVSIEDVPTSFLHQIDELFTLFRPEYYGIQEWMDGSPTNDQLQFYHLKEELTHSVKCRLWLNTDKRIVKSYSPK
jgi:hypothetical protein